MRTSNSWLFHRSILLAIVGLGLVGNGVADAQQFTDVSRSGPRVVRAFQPVVRSTSLSAVRVRGDGKDIALGTVVGADGWIMSKASEVTGRELVCKFRDGMELPARIVGVHEAYDLALLKVDAKGLTPVAWRDTKDTAVGKWVITVGVGEEPVAIGVVSVATRTFKAGDQPPKTSASNGGYLGVGLDEAEGGAKIIAVNKGTPAEKAGLKVNDVVTHIAGKKVLDSESMSNAVGRFKPGDEVAIRLRRDKEEMELKATLAKRPPGLFGNPQELMGSTLSNRRGGFPTILQHDTVIKPSDCGGPLVDLDGKVLGINIARAGRTESYAVPAEAVRQLLPELMSGKLAPRDDGSQGKSMPRAN